MVTAYNVLAGSVLLGLLFILSLEVSGCAADFSRAYAVFEQFVAISQVLQWFSIAVLVLLAPAGTEMAVRILFVGMLTESMWTIFSIRRGHQLLLRDEYYRTHPEEVK